MEKQDQKLNYLISNASATVYLDDQPKTIFKDDPSFLEACQALRDRDWKKVSKLFDVSIKSKSDGQMRREGDKIQVLCNNEWKDVPEDLGMVIQKFIDMELPFEPLVAFAINLLQNPSQNSINQLFSFIKVNDLCLDDQGFILFSKVVTKDFKDIHSQTCRNREICGCKTYDNSIGAIVEMDRSKVVEDPTQLCKPGLHVCAWHYVTSGGFARFDQNDVCILVKVNPRDVVSVPHDYNMSKVRCCRYEVIGLIDHKFTEPLYSAERGFYGKTDKQSFAILEDEYQAIE